MGRLSEKSQKRENKICSNILKDCAASIFRVTELCSRQYQSDWDEEMSSLYRQVVKIMATSYGKGRGD
jgi:hypothetical protein